MAQQSRKPGSRATRNRLIKNWHMWLVVWLLVVAAIVYGGYRMLGPQTAKTQTSVDHIGAVVIPSDSPRESPVASPSPEVTTAVTMPTPSLEPEPVATVVPLDKSVRVVIYNNTSRTGYAERTADKAKALGWNVVQTANWQGSVPASTVFYSGGLKAEAQQLAQDLGILRVQPNLRGISLTGLSVVLRS